MSTAGRRSETPVVSYEEWLAWMDTNPSMADRLWMMASNHLYLTEKGRDGIIQAALKLDNGV